VVITFIDITNLTRAEAHQQVLIAELQHRTRNLLAIVQSIAKQTFGKTQAAGSFSTRLTALGRVQSLISKAAVDSQINLEEVIRLELQAHGSGQGDGVVVEGPPVTLDFGRIQTLALALHELATNAVKYGALNGNGGRLEVVWTRTVGKQGDPWLVLNWRESQVTMPADTSRQGYGRKLIEKALTFTLRAKTELTFGEDGVSCRIEMPLESTAAVGRYARMAEHV
jgi:two-component system CheB/CheR fusion protein